MPWHLSPAGIGGINDLEVRVGHEEFPVEWPFGSTRYVCRDKIADAS